MNHSQGRILESVNWGRGGGCIYVIFKFISKEISWAEHEYMNIHPPPPPINALATALTSVN